MDPKAGTDASSDLGVVPSPNQQSNGNMDGKCWFYCLVLFDCSTFTHQQEPFLSRTQETAFAQLHQHMVTTTLCSLVMVPMKTLMIQHLQVPLETGLVSMDLENESFAVVVLEPNAHAPTTWRTKGKGHQVNELLL